MSARGVSACRIALLAGRTASDALQCDTALIHRQLAQRHASAEQLMAAGLSQQGALSAGSYLAMRETASHRAHWSESANWPRTWKSWSQRTVPRSSMHCTTSRSPRVAFHTTSPLYAGLTPHYEPRAGHFPRQPGALHRWGTIEECRGQGSCLLIPAHT